MTSTKAQLLGQLEALRLLIEQLPDGSTGSPTGSTGSPTGSTGSPTGSTGSPTGVTTDDSAGSSTEKPTFQPMSDNQARAYGVTVAPVMPVRAVFWRVVEVRHLGPAENKGRHGVYVDAVDSLGQRVRNLRLRIGYTWEGRQPTEKAEPVALDKPDGETGHGMVDIYKGQKLSVWLTGDGLASDVVQGIHSNHPDELGPNGETWNSVGHHSFYVKFQIVGE